MALYPIGEEFIDRFIPNMSPAVTSFVALNSNFIPPNFKEGFNFIDLGCGRAKTLLLLAELFPKGNFWGVDFNAESIFYAKEKAKELGLKNVNFLNVSFEELIKDKSLPEFDFISMAGLYTWITPQAKEAVKEFVREKLKKGGILYLEFYAIPGGINNAVFWKFIRELVPEDLPDSQRGDIALELFEIFLNRPTRYLIDHQKTRGAVQNYLKNKDELKKHLIHNVLPKNAFPMFFFEVYDDFRETGVKFAGRTELALNDPEISLFPSHLPTYVKFKKEPRLRETVVDFILNLGEHHDVWVKGEEVSPQEAAKYINENFFLIPRQKPERLRRVLALPGGHRFPLTDEIYSPFYSKGEEPVRLEDHPLFEKNPETVKRAFYKVAASGEFFICSFEENLRPINEIEEELPEELEVSKGNLYLLENAFKGLKGTVLTSKVTGGAAVNLSSIEVILLYTALKEGKSMAIEGTLNYLSEVDSEISILGERKRTKEVKREEVERAFKGLFKGRKAFNLQRLNIVKGR